MKTLYTPDMSFNEETFIKILSDLLAMRYQIEIVSPYYIRSESKKEDNYNEAYKNYMEIGRENLDNLNKAIVAIIKIITIKKIKIDLYVETLEEIKLIHNEFKNKIVKFIEIKENPFESWKNRILEGN